MLGCGRINYDLIEPPTAGDAASDGPAVCPSDTLPITAGSKTCIEKVERGNMTWTDADAMCRAAGRSLCSDAQWLTACQQVPSLIDMFNDGNGATPEWEWVAEVMFDQGSKRGVGTCSDTATHEIFAMPYDFRCCVTI